MSYLQVVGGEYLTLTNKADITSIVFYKEKRPVTIYVAGRFLHVKVKKLNR
jgi:hypothetical protein